MTGQSTNQTGMRSLLGFSSRLALAAAIACTACYHIKPSRGGALAPASPVLPSYATYVDTNDNGKADANDELFLRFDPSKRAPVIDASFLDRLRLPVLRSYLGQGPTVTAGADEFEVCIKLGVVPLLKTRQVADGSTNAVNTPTFIEYTAQGGGVTTVDLVPGFKSQFLGLSASASAIACADFDGDGATDLAIASDYDIILALGDGQNGFPTVIVASDPDDETGNCLRVADIDHDGDPDLIVGTSSGFKLWTVERKDGDVSLNAPSAAFGSDPVLDLELGDFDADGQVDVATASAGEGMAGLWLGDGSGHFDPQGKGAPGTSYDVLAADIDGDGDLDLLLANENDDTRGVFFFEGDGEGGLSLNSNLFAGSPVRSLALGDLNGDGQLDLVAAIAADATNAEPRTSSLTWNGTEFVLANGVIEAPRALPHSLLLLDVDGDSHLDLVAEDASGVQVLMNDGAGNLRDSGHAYALAVNGAICAADNDEDGDLDLFVPTATGVERLAASLSGTWGRINFVEGEQMLGSHSTFGLASADLNGDGILDFAIANNLSIEIFIGLGQAEFDAPIEIPVPNARVRDIEFRDLNMDGHLDLVAALQGVPGIGFPGLMIRLGDGSANFPTDDSVPGTSSQASAFAIGDLDNDGDLDVVLAGMNGLADQLIMNGGRDLGVWAGMLEPVRLGDAFGGETSDVHTSDVAIADINADGSPDVLTAHAPGTANGIWLGDGTGLFTYNPLPNSLNLDSRSIAAGDINQDGQLDIVTGNTVGETLWLQDNGSFPLTILLTNSDTYEVQLVELNGDAFPDLLVTNRGNEQEEGLQVWLNQGVQTGQGVGGAWNGFGTGGNPNFVLRHGYIESVLAADLDGDGDIDFVTGNTDSRFPNAFWRNW